MGSFLSIKSSIYPDVNSYGLNYCSTEKSGAVDMLYKLILYVKVISNFQNTFFLFTIPGTFSIYLYQEFKSLDRVLKISENKVILTFIFVADSLFSFFYFSASLPQQTILSYYQLLGKNVFSIFFHRKKHSFCLYQQIFTTQHLSKSCSFHT